MSRPTYHEIAEALRAASPEGRLQRHREVWGNDPPPDVASRLSIVITMLEESGGRASSAAMLILAELDHRRTAQNWTTCPDTVRGARVQHAASEGGKTVADPRREEWAAYQAYIDAEYSKNPRLSYGDLQRRAAKKFDCSIKTIARRTTNPRKK